MVFKYNKIMAHVLLLNFNTSTFDQISSNFNFLQMKHFLIQDLHSLSVTFIFSLIFHNLICFEQYMTVVKRYNNIHFDF